MDWKRLRDNIQDSLTDRGRRVPPNDKDKDKDKDDEDDEDDEDDDDDDDDDDDEDDDEDDEDEEDEEYDASQKGKKLTLTAIRYGNLTLTLRAGQSKLPFLLGRNANCAEFLQQDPRVGNEHCFLDFRDGVWMVINKKARNGTAVGDTYLRSDGSAVLYDGAVLKLGHHGDSMAFRVRIQ